jgi:hypothetical protein
MMTKEEDWKEHQGIQKDGIKDSGGNIIQGGSNMTGTDLCVNKPHCAAAVRP